MSPCPPHLHPRRRPRPRRPSTIRPSGRPRPLHEGRGCPRPAWIGSSPATRSPLRRSRPSHDGGPLSHRARHLIRTFSWAVLALSLLALAAPVRAASPTENAGIHAKSAAEQFADGNWEQALIEFRLAYEAVHNPDYLFNMAQCEYHLGLLKE